MTEDSLGDKSPQIRNWVMANEMTTPHIYMSAKKVTPGGSVLLRLILSEIEIHEYQWINKLILPPPTNQETNERLPLY